MPSMSVFDKKTLSEDQFLALARFSGVIDDPPIPEKHSIAVHNHNIDSRGHCPLCDKGSEAVPGVILEEVQ